MILESYRPANRQGHDQGETQSHPKSQVKVQFTVRATRHFLDEEDRGEIKLNKPRRQKLRFTETKFNTKFLEAGEACKATYCNLPTFNEGGKSSIALEFQQRSHWFLRPQYPTVGDLRQT